MFSSADIDIRIIVYLFVGGGILMGYSYKKIKRKNHMQITPKQLLSSASAGSVEIEGVAWPFRAVFKSMSGEKIVFRQIIIERHQRRGKSSTWVKVWSKVSSTPFMVFDQSGFIIINPDIPENLLSIEDLKSTEYKPYYLKESQKESFYELYDNSLSGFSIRANEGWLASLFSNSSSYRITERFIPLGSPLLVHGCLVPEDKFRYVHMESEQQLYFERVRKILKNKSFRKAVFDKNHDGEVDEAELRRGFKSVLAASLKQIPTITNLKENGESFERVCGLMIGTPIQPLVICESFEEQFLKSRPVYWNWLSLYLGGAMIALAVLLFLKFY